jgi:phospholipid/cholesterol/gamma-HCH transport system permease protein
VWPRIASGTAALVLLVVWGNIVALCGATLVAYWAFAVPIGYFYQTYVEQLALLDYFMSLTKGLAFGMIVTTIASANGYSTKSGAAAVGNATRESVVAAALTVIVADFLITMVFLRPA